MQVKTKHNSQILLFSCIFLLTVIAWIAVEIYHIERNKKFQVEYQTGMQMTIETLPNLKVLEKLKIKK